MLISAEQKLFMLINVKMPTIVGILTFISMINDTSESLKARKVLIFSILVFVSVMSPTSYKLVHAVVLSNDSLYVFVSVYIS